jgi:hypothetical protein
VNDYDLQVKRNNTARLFRHSSKIHRNCIRLNSGSTWEHELAKIYECRRLLREGKEFITEAVFEDGRRADIVVLDDAEVIEIQHSESDESIEEKRKAYPLPLRVVKA